jgi:hypothetical protein
MAVVLAYTFTSGGFDYSVYVDDVNLIVTAETDNPTFVDEVPSGDVPMGSSQYNFCIGTTRYDVIADNFYPFGYLEPEEDSLSCGFVPIVCDLTLSVATSDEPEPDGEDGSATGSSTTTHGPVEYSLDNITFQSSGVFSNLPAGSYTMYARDNAGCTASSAFAIGTAAAVIPPYYPWQEVPCNFFRLNGQLISEPVKWDSINVVGERDKVYHGWNYQFTDEVVDLEFDVDAGYYIIDGVYNAAGSDGDIVFEYGYRELGVDYVLFTGKLDLNTLKKYPHKYACAVKRFDGNSLVETRVETKVSMAAATGLDGAVITPPTPQDFVLHGKAIRKSYLVNDAQPKAAVNSGGATINGYSTLDNTVVQLQEIETMYNYPAFTSGTTPWDDNKYLLDVKFAGSYQFRIKFGAFIAYTKPFPLSFPTSGTMQYAIAVNGVETLLGSPVTQLFSSTSSVNLEIDQTLTLNLAVGDKVYVYIKHTFTHARPWGVTVSQNFNESTIQSEETAIDTPAKGWWLFDAVDHVIRAITNNQSRLKSTFLRRVPSAGQAGLHILTNGYQIRQYEVASRPMIISLKTALESLRSLFCIGVLYDTDQVRVERADYFYQDNEILYIDEVADLNKEVAKDILYNEIEIGYNEFQNEGYNTLDEFNTKHEYLTPIKTNKLKLVALSQFIASGYSIETVRRKQFSQTPTEATQDDDKVYIISMRPDAGEYKPEKDEPFATVTDLISPETAYNLRLSPKRMLYNWMVWLKNVFHFKVGTDVIKNTFVAQNGELTTQLSPGDTRPIGDIGLISLKESDNAALNSITTDRSLFIPEWIKFKCRLQPDQVEMLNRALKGKLGAAKNFGYVRYLDPTDGLVTGWPYKLEYNFYTEEAELTLLRRP